MPKRDPNWAERTPVTADEVKNWLSACSPDQPIESKDPRYVPLHAFKTQRGAVSLRGEDPILPVFDTITLSGWLKVRDALGSKIDSLRHDAHEFVGEVVATLKRRFPKAPGVVFLFDSLERLRGPENEFHHGQCRSRPHPIC